MADPFGAVPGLQTREGVAGYINGVVARDGRALKAVGSVVGMAVADAVGHPLEFLPVVDGSRNRKDRTKALKDRVMDLLPSWFGESDEREQPPSSPHFVLSPSEMRYVDPMNRFTLDPGQWTDDASMGLCLADSLLHSAARSQSEKGHAEVDTLDGSDLRCRFHAWWFHGYNNAFARAAHRGEYGRRSVGLGGNIGQSLRSMEIGAMPSSRYEADNEDAGNGSLMRLSPVPVRFFYDANGAARATARESSYATHPGPIAACACEFFSYLTASAISDKDLPADCPSSANVKAWIDAKVKNFLRIADSDPAAHSGSGWEALRKLLNSSEPADSTECNWNWRSSKLSIWRAIRNRGREYNGYPVIAGYFGAYSLDGLAMALHCVYNTTTFNDALVRCVNFNGDADSTGSMVGQLAGAMYGFNSIEERMRANLERWDPLGRVALRGALLFDLALAESEK